MQCMIFGTRPEIIKFSPIIKEYEKRKLPYFVIHTGQHYDNSMSSDLFIEFQLPTPKYNLGLTNVPDMITSISNILVKEKPRSVMVLGDTNSTLAGALATNRQTRITGANPNGTLTKIPLIHVEAGLRSFDIVMAEEVNRMIADHLSTILFAPTDIAMVNLANENVGGKVFVVGNTIADVVHLVSAKSSDCILVTLHRAENVDNEDRLKNILMALEDMSLPVYFPIHPRTAKKMREFGMGTLDNVQFMSPVSHKEMVQLISSAACVVTDSGGIQEEACILGTHCVTVRDTTERPETIQLGANVVVGMETVDIIKGVTEALKLPKPAWRHHPYGVNVAERIVDKCQEILG